MKSRHIYVILFVIIISGFAVPGAFAAEKSKVLTQLDAARAATETVAGRIEGNKEAAADIERARTALKYADESYNAGKSMFGFGSLTPEAEKEVMLAVDMAELATATALSKIEFVRATGELEAIEKQFVTVKAKLKLFEDRTAELVRLRLAAEAGRKASNELEIIKLEKAELASQVDQLTAERSRADKLKIEQLELTRKMDDMKAENARLTAALEKLQAEHAVPAAMPPEDLKKKSSKKP
ncbi:MAG: hypothetical protein PHI31_11005 [Desulfuromonadaceae bacterium]|nr:hypothetical protein [Desulfuromonadaceae bacterium]